MSPSDFHDGPRLIASDLPGRWSRPTAIVDLARCLEPLVYMPTPIPRLERADSSVGCSPAHQRPSPYVRRVGSSKQLSRPAQSSRVSACTLAPWLRQGLLQRLQPDDCSPRLLQWLPGRTDNSPDGTCTRWHSRPRRSPPSHPQLTADLLSCRTDKRCASGGDGTPGRPPGVLYLRLARQNCERRPPAGRNLLSLGCQPQVGE